MRWFATFVCALLQLSVRTAHTQGCAYFYSEQPPERLSCNPYVQGEMRLECTAHGPRDAVFGLAWFRRTAVEAPAHPSGASRQKAAGAEVLGSGSGTAILFQHRILETGRRTVRSQLRVRLQNGSQSELGSYCCSVVAATIQGEVAVSDVLVLEGTEAYAGLPSCSTRAQSKDERKCAVGPQPQPTATVLPGASSLQLTPLDSSVEPAITLQARPSSQLSSSVGVYAVSPPGPSLEGGPKLLVIVLSALAGVVCAAALLCVSSCVYLHRHRRKMKGRTFASAINHTYTNTSFRWEWGRNNDAVYHSAGPGGVYTTAAPVSSSSPSSLSCGTASAGGVSSDHYVEMSVSLDWRRRLRDHETGSSSSPAEHRGELYPGAQHPNKYSVSESVALAGDSREEGGPLRGVLLEPDSEYVNVACRWPAVCWTPSSDVESKLHPDLEWRPQQLYSYPQYPHPRVHRQYSTSSYDGMYVMPVQGCPQTPPPDSCHASNGHHYEEIIDTVVNLAYLNPHSVVMERNPSYRQGSAIAAGSSNSLQTATTASAAMQDREPGEGGSPREE